MKKRTISVLSAAAGTMAGAAAVVATAGKAAVKRYNQAQDDADKHRALFLMMNQWVKIKQQGKNLSSYFERNGYRIIAIYGMGFAGETLVEELKDTEVQVAFGIDQNADTVYADVETVTIDQEWEVVDAIVVTAITYFDEIKEKLSAKTDCPIISLEDILCEV
jgi:hypothetical protein